MATSAITFVDAQQSTANVNSGNSYGPTLSLGIGDAHPNRIIIMGTLTPGGTTGQPIVTPDAGSPVSLSSIGDDGDVDGFIMWSGVVPTGTTATFEIPITASSANRAALAIWYYYPADTTALDVVLGSAAGTTDAVAADVAIVAGGAMAIWGGQRGVGSGTYTLVWGGTDTPTIDDNGNVESASSWVAASFTPTQSSTTLDMTLQATNSGQKHVICATWGVQAGGVAPKMHQYRLRRAA